MNHAAYLPDDLWQACFSPPVEGRWWYDTMERSGLEDQFTFEYALLKKDGQPAGIAPAFWFDVPIDLVAPPVIAKVLVALGKVLPKLRYQRTLFIGSPCADEGTLGVVDPADLPAAVQALQAVLPAKVAAGRASMLVWKDLPAEYHASFEPVIRSGKIFPAVSYPGTRLSLSGKDFAGYLASLKSSHRHQIKKKLKRSREMGQIDSAVVERPDAKTLDEIFPLFWQTYEKGKTKFEVLNRTFFDLIADVPGAVFITLRDAGAGGRMVAFMLCFRIGDRVINKFIGIDYTYDGNWYLYFRLLESAIDWAVRGGATDFQSGQTGYRAKTDSGHSLVPLTNYCRAKNPVLNFIFAKVAAGISWKSLDTDLKTWVEAHPDGEAAQWVGRSGKIA